MSGTVSKTQNRTGTPLFQSVDAATASFDRLTVAGQVVTAGAGGTGISSVSAEQGQVVPGQNSTVILKFVKTDGTEDDISLTLPAGAPGQEESGGGDYTLPVATATALGGIRVGSGLSITNSGVLSAEQGTPGGQTGISEVLPRTGNYTLSASDAGNILRSDDNAAVTYTVPIGLTTGHSFTVVQGGAGQIRFVAEQGVTISNFSGDTHSGGQWARCHILMLSATSALLDGTTAP